MFSSSNCIAVKVDIVEEEPRAQRSIYDEIIILKIVTYILIVTICGIATFTELPLYMLP